jgi:hypothetical protein
MYKYTKSIIKACEKASINIARDIIEVSNLHSSRNLAKFLNSSQGRFEKNIASELSSEASDITVFLSDGSSKNIYDPYKISGKGGNAQAIVVGIDNMINLGHGIETIGFGITLQFPDRDKATAVCLPTTNTIIYSDDAEQFFSLSQDGLTRKIRINQSININFPTVVCSTDHHNHGVSNYLLKRELHFISSGSILCDLVRVLTNKVDIVFYNRPHRELFNFISYIINGAGGSDGFVGDSYVFGRKLLVKAIVGNVSTEEA